jgi:ERCC4-type nuclease
MLDIEIDTREEPSGIPRLLAERLGARVAVRQLPVADYVIGGMGVERKTSTDLVASIYDGRAFDQARRLTSAFPRTALVVEGMFPPPACDGREELYLSSLCQMSWSLGLRVFPTRFPLDSAILLTRFAQWEFDQAVHPPTHLLAGRFSKPRHATDRRLFLLQGFFGVGPERARNLLKAFGSLRSVFSAPQEAWEEVEGVGRKLAGDMRELLDDEREVGGARGAGFRVGG